MFHLKIIVFCTGWWHNQFSHEHNWIWSCGNGSSSPDGGSDGGSNEICAWCPFGIVPTRCLNKSNITTTYCYNKFENIVGDGLY